VSGDDGPTLIVAEDLDELWLAATRRGRVHELDVVRAGAPGCWGAICLARVLRVRPGLCGAFADAGLDEQAFVVTPRSGPPLSEGQKLPIRIVRHDPAKGPRGTTDVTLPGVLLVLVPGRPGYRVSRRVRDPALRRRLSGLAEKLPEAGHGWIVRAAAAEASQEELAGEAERLAAEWERVASAVRAGGPVGPLWQEPDPACRFVRERLGMAPERIVVDGEGAQARLREMLTLPGGRPALPLVPHSGEAPAVLARGLEHAAWEALAPRVPLPGGGGLVVEATQALTAIDVNAGRDLAGEDGEQAALRVNREAAVEGARQITLRNLAGLIAIDFVELRTGRAREQVDTALATALRDDPARTHALPMSRFSITEISRQYHGPPLAERLGAPCPHCAGAGTGPGLGAQARRLLRRVRQSLSAAPGQRVEARGPAEVLEEARRLAGNPRVGADLDLGGRVLWLRGARLEVRLADEA
jgi:Rne/Rng family ribonuclease